jgi:hypothetical protein
MVLQTVLAQLVDRMLLEYPVVVIYVNILYTKPVYIVKLSQSDSVNTI